MEILKTFNEFKEEFFLHLEAYNDLRNLGYTELRKEGSNLNFLIEGLAYSAYREYVNTVLVSQEKNVFTASNRINMIPDLKAMNYLPSPVLSENVRILKSDLNSLIEASTGNVFDVNTMAKRILKVVGGGKAFYAINKNLTDDYLIFYAGNFIEVTLPVTVGTNSELIATVDGKISKHFYCYHISESYDVDLIFNSKIKEMMPLVDYMFFENTMNVYDKDFFSIYESGTDLYTLNFSPSKIVNDGDDIKFVYWEPYTDTQDLSSIENFTWNDDYNETSIGDIDLLFPMKSLSSVVREEYTEIPKKLVESFIFNKTISTIEDIKYFVKNKYSSWGVRYIESLRYDSEYSEDDIFKNSNSNNLFLYGVGDKIDTNTINLIYNNISNVSFLEIEIVHMNIINIIVKTNDGEHEAQILSTILTALRNKNTDRYVKRIQFDSILDELNSKLVEIGKSMDYINIYLKCENLIDLSLEQKEFNFYSCKTPFIYNNENYLNNFVKTSNLTVKYYLFDRLFNNLDLGKTLLTNENLFVYEPIISNDNHVGVSITEPVNNVRYLELKTGFLCDLGVGN